MKMRVIPAVETESGQRLRFVESALGSLRIEGLELDAQARAIADRYIAGAMCGEELTRALLELP